MPAISAIFHLGWKHNFSFQLLSVYLFVSTHIETVGRPVIENWLIVRQLIGSVSPIELLALKFLNCWLLNFISSLSSL